MFADFRVSGQFYAEMKARLRQTIYQYIFSGIPEFSCAVNLLPVCQQLPDIGI